MAIKKPGSHREKLASEEGDEKLIKITVLSAIPLLSFSSTTNIN
jgi:hypothetical protein